MADETVLPIPNLSLAQHFFTLITPSLKNLQENARNALLEGITADRTSICYEASPVIVIL
jgi:26S proteasome regulatory subunit N7